MVKSINEWCWYEDCLQYWPARLGDVSISIYIYISPDCNPEVYNDIVLLLSSEYMYEFDVAESSMSTMNLSGSELIGARAGPEKRNLARKLLGDTTHISK